MADKVLFVLLGVGGCKLDIDNSVAMAMHLPLAPGRLWQIWRSAHPCAVGRLTRNARQSGQLRLTRPGHRAWRLGARSRLDHPLATEPTLAPEPTGNAATAISVISRRSLDPMTPSAIAEWNEQQDAPKLRCEQNNGSADRRRGVEARGPCARECGGIGSA